MRWRDAAALHHAGVGFFDAFLSGKRPRSIPRVRWHLGNDGWHDSPTWPPPGACEQVLHLANDGELRSDPGPAGEIRWVHDPQNLVPSTIENPFAFLYEYPDEAAVAARDDVVVFTSEPLTAPLTLAGRVVAQLRVAATDRRCTCTSSWWTSPPRRVAHPALRPGAVDRPGAGTGPRSIWDTPATA